MRYLIENHVTGSLLIVDSKESVESFLNEIGTAVNKVDIEEDLSIYKLDSLPQVKIVNKISIED